MKKAKVAKSSKSNEKKLAQFVRDHVTVRLVRLGFTPDSAACLCDDLTDEEIIECCGKAQQKVGAFGDGSWLKWLKDHKADILDGVEKIYGFLSLIAPFITSKGKANEQEEDDSDDDEETEEDEDEGEDEEDEDAGKKRPR